MKTLNKFLWVEAYRPSSIKGTLLPASMKRSFTNLVKAGEIPNLLFHSTSPGVGKTTVAKALCKEMNIDDYMFINTSSERGIDTLRNRVRQYASVKSMTGNNKVVIMDEFDDASPDLQNALKAAIEQYLSCRFIFTANHISKIIAPLQSRCQIFDFNMTNEKVKKEMVTKIQDRLVMILKHRNIDFEEYTIEKLVKTFYPDIRKMLGLLQQYSNQNENIDDNIFNYEQIDDEFYDLLKKKSLTKARKYLIDKGYNYADLYRNLYDNFVPGLSKDKQGQVILLIADYQYRHAFVIDHEINSTALLLEIIGVL